MISCNDYFEVSLNSDDNENSIHFIDSNNDFEYIEEEEEADNPPRGDDDEHAGEPYYTTIEIDDDFDTDFEKDSLIA